MNTSGRQEEYISFFNVMFCKVIYKCIVFNAFYISIGSYFFFESRIQECARSSIDNIPHFGLPERVVSFLCQFIVWMYLYRQIVACIYKLDKQRKCSAERLEILLSEQLLFVCRNNFVETFVFQRTVGHYRNVAFHTRYFPAFADPFLKRAYVFKLTYFVSPPDDGFEDRFKF